MRKVSPRTLIVHTCDRDVGWLVADDIIILKVEERPNPLDPKSKKFVVYYLQCEPWGEK